MEGEGPSERGMKILSLNVRGLNAPSRKQRLKNCTNKYKLDFSFIQETKLSNIELEKFTKKLGFRKLIGVPSEGALGGLATFGIQNLTKLNS